MALWQCLARWGASRGRMMVTVDGGVVAGAPRRLREAGEGRRELPGRSRIGRQSGKAYAPLGLHPLRKKG